MAVLQVGDKTAVDFDRVRRKVFQVGQAGIAGAEIIYRQAYAQRFQAVQRCFYRTSALQQRAFGHFDFQLRRRQAGITQGAGHQLGKARLQQLPRRYVHRHGQRRVLLRPGGGQLARLLQHPAADFHDQAGFFCHRNKLGRRGGHAVGVGPAQQRLEAGQAAVFHPVFGLQHQVQLLARQGAAQAVFQQQALAHLGGHAFGKEAVVVAALRFGFVHGHVGIFQQQLGVFAVIRADGNTDAGGNHQLVAIQHKRLAQGVQHALGDQRGLGVVGQLGQDHHELVAASAANGVHVAHHGAGAPGDLLQQGVAGGVAQGVVDVLETVQVHEQHGHLVAAALGHAQRLLQAVHQQQAVGQVGQVVVFGQVLHPCLGFFALADIGKQRDIVGERAVAIAQGVDAEPLGVDFACFAPVPDFARPLAARGQVVPQVVEEVGVVLARAEQGRGLPQRFGLAIAGDGGKGLVHGHDAAGGVGNHDGFGAGFKYLGRQAQLAFLFDAGANIAGGGAAVLLALVVHGAEFDFQRYRPVAAQQLQLGAVAVWQGAGKQLLQGVLVAAVKALARALVAVGHLPVGVAQHDDVGGAVAHVAGQLDFAGVLFQRVLPAFYLLAVAVGQLAHPAREIQRKQHRQQQGSQEDTQRGQYAGLGLLAQALLQLAIVAQQHAGGGHGNHAPAPGGHAANVGGVLHALQAKVDKAAHRRILQALLQAGAQCGVARQEALQLLALLVQHDKAAALAGAHLRQQRQALLLQVHGHIVYVFAPPDQPAQRLEAPCVGHFFCHALFTGAVPAVAGKAGTLGVVRGGNEAAHDVGAGVVAVVQQRAAFQRRVGGQQDAIALQGVDKKVTTAVKVAQRAQRFDDFVPRAVLGLAGMGVGLVQRGGQGVGLVYLLLDTLAQQGLCLLVQGIQRDDGVVTPGTQKGLAVLQRLLLHGLAVALVVLPLLVKKVAGQQDHDSNYQAQHARQLQAGKAGLVGQK